MSEWQRIPDEENDGEIRPEYFEQEQHEPDDDGNDVTDTGHEERSPGSPMFRSIAILTITLEGFTCLLRFGLGMESTRDTASSVGRWTGGIRIHHGYIGIALLLTARWCQTRRSRPVASVLQRRRMQIVGWSLVASDLIHHFLVLWPITGSPHFDLVYPK